MKRGLVIAAWFVGGAVAGIALYAVLVMLLGALGFYSLAVNTAFVFGFVLAVAGAGVALWRCRNRGPALYSFLAGLLLLLGYSSIQVLVLQPQTVWPLNLWA